jgi:hypothetical protein
MAHGHQTSPWLSVWVSPRKTVRGLIGSSDSPEFWLLCGLFGLPQYFEYARSFGGGLLLEQVLFKALFVGPLIGWLQVVFLSWLFGCSGRCLGGQATPRAVRCAVSWATLPIGSLSLGWALLIARFGPNLFDGSMMQIAVNSAGVALTFKVALVTTVLMILWSMILLINTLSVAHQFSVQRAVAAVALGLGACSVPLFIFALAISLVGMPAPRSH